MLTGYLSMSKEKTVKNCISVSKRRFFSALFMLMIGILAIASAVGLAEEVKITTIVPSQPTVSTVRGDRGAIGTTYKNMTDTQIGDNNFIVQGNVGIGVNDVRALTSPINGIATGNLSANYIWVRGAQQWISQARLGDWISIVPPPYVPGTVHFADTDGFVCACINFYDDPNKGSTMEGFTGPDPLLPWNTSRKVYVRNTKETPEMSITMPVKRGDYWKVTITPAAVASIMWIPFNT